MTSTRQKNSGIIVVVGLLLAITVAMGACAPKETPAPVAPAAPIAATPPTAPAVPGQAKTATEQEWDKVLAAARKEGSVNFYSTFAQPDLRIAMSKAMQDTYGIKMEWVVSAGATNAERIRVEAKTKQYVADVWWTGLSVLLTEELRAVDALAVFTPPVVAQEPEVWKDKGVYTITDKGDALAVTLGRGMWPIVNTKLLRPEEYPRSYRDLLDPRWKGRIVMHDPTVSGGGSVAFNLVKMALGLEYWEKAKQQNIAFIRDYGEVGRRVATGEAAIALGLSPTHYMNFLVVGAPIKPIPIEEGAYSNSRPMSLINHGPNPNAGRVLINWVLTKEGQSIISRFTGDEPIRKDVEFKYHPEVEIAMRATTKWLVDSWEVKQLLDQTVSDGVARKLFELK